MMAEKIEIENERHALEDILSEQLGEEIIWVRNKYPGKTVSQILMISYNKKFFRLHNQGKRLDPLLQDAYRRYYQIIRDLE